MRSKDFAKASGKLVGTNEVERPRQGQFLQFVQSVQFLQFVQSVQSVQFLQIFLDF